MITEKYVRRLIGYCDEWNYNNKETCKYVVESIMEKHDKDFGENRELYDDLMSMVHNVNKGGNFYEVDIPT